MTSMDLAIIKIFFFLFKVGGGTCLIETHQELLIAQEIHSCVKPSLGPNLTIWMAVRLSSSSYSRARG